MRIAIIGAGIAGIATASLLDADHEVVVFEAADRLGGHSHTVEVKLDGTPIGIDTGFIVHNERNYPVFRSLLERWGVECQASDMSFSVSVPSTGLEYSGAGFGGLFAQRGNLLRPSFWRLLTEIARFGRRGRAALAAGGLDPTVTTAHFLAANGLTGRFRRDYLVPLGSAVWSANPQRLEDFPAEALLRFLDNHGLLVFRDRPRWLTITGGSRRYLEAFAASCAAELRTSSAVASLERCEDHVIVTSSEGAERFDLAVVATHSDEALALLADPSAAEVEVLSAVRYRLNDVVLHSDASAMPANRRAWASWNYLRDAEEGSAPTVTYWMNRLQDLDCGTDLFVSLNRTSSIDPTKVLGRYRYAHPAYDVAAFAAQQRWAEVNGPRRTYFAGAWWGYGFHEDGADSGARVAEAIG